MDGFFLEISEGNFVAFLEYVHKAAPVFFTHLTLIIGLSNLESLFGTVKYEIRQLRSDLNIKVTHFPLIAPTRLSIHFLIRLDLLPPILLARIGLLNPLLF